MHKTSLRDKPPDAGHRTASISPEQETESSGGVRSCKGMGDWLKSLSSTFRQVGNPCPCIGKHTRSHARLKTGERRTEALRCLEADRDGVGKKLICSLRQVCIIRPGIIGFDTPEADGVLVQNDTIQ